MSNAETERGPDEREMERLRHAKRLFEDKLLSVPGAHGVGIGFKKTEGRRTGEIAIVIFVDRKLSRDQVPAEEMIEPELRFYWETSDEQTSVLTDVVERPRPVEYAHIDEGQLQEWTRPVPGGRRLEPSGGTLGGWVWDAEEGQVVLLTNEHVIGTQPGTEVFQPDALSQNNLIGHVVRAGDLDAAIAAPTDEDEIVARAVEGIGPAVYETAEPALGMKVEKSGQRTEHTTGEIITVDVGANNDFVVEPEDGVEIGGVEVFAFFGDSGSLIFDREQAEGADWKSVVGLLWGGNPTAGTSSNHQINDVFDDLDLVPLCSGTLSDFADQLFTDQFAHTPSATRAATLAEEDGARLSRVRPPSAMPPLSRRRQPRRPRPPEAGFARDVEKRLRSMRRGNEVVEAVHRHRVPVVRLLLERETRRALEATAARITADVYTPKELLERELTDEDVALLRRAVALVAEREPDLRELVSMVESLLAGASGRSLQALLS